MSDEDKKITSSSAEYLTFIASGGESEKTVEIRYENENIWLTQKLMAELYDVSVSAINQHLKRLLSDSELDENATIKKFLIVQTEGKRQVQRSVDHYNLLAIISVGFKIENERAVQFRNWATTILKAYVTSNRVRHIIEGKELTQLATNATFSTRDLKASPTKYRTLIPEYIKDYVPLNPFVA